MLRTLGRTTLVLGLLAGASVAAGPRPAGAWTSPETTVSSTGATVVAPATGRPGRSAVATPVSSPVASIESIIGPDGRTPAGDTTSFPNRAIVLITYGGSHLCSGSLIDPDTVLTAGHCVHDGGGGGWLAVDQFRVWPGYDPSRADPAPYGSCTARSLHSLVGWTRDADDRYDIGAIKLTCSVGATTGYLGWWWQNPSLAGKPTTITGYPGDKSPSMWTHKDQVWVSETQRVYYANDTIAGSSGSAVMMRRSSANARCAGWCLMAVHAYGIGGPYPSSTYNHGARVTRAVSDALFYWSDL